MSRKYRKVAVLMGGPSSERDVSLRSGAAVVQGLRENGYEVAGIDVQERKVDLPSGTEAVFVALHGAFGEDGEVQAVLAGMGVPFTGSGAAASNAAFDKVISKDVFRKAGISTPAYEVLDSSKQARKLGLPAVVKPARQGSSIGVGKVFRESEWTDAVTEAFAHDARVIVEEYIDGRELTVGVVGEEVLPVIEIVAPGDWYNYRAKYTKGETRYIVPAEIGEPATAACRDLARRTFHALGCKGFGRIDLRLSNDGAPYVLELNSIPGFTETSLLPKAAAFAGVDFPELCGRIMEMAEVSH